MRGRCEGGGMEGERRNEGSEGGKGGRDGIEGERRNEKSEGGK